MSATIQTLSSHADCRSIFRPSYIHIFSFACLNDREMWNIILKKINQDSSQMELSRPDGEIPENAFDKPALPCNGNSAAIIEGKLFFPF